MTMEARMGVRSVMDSEVSYDIFHYGTEYDIADDDPEGNDYVVLIWLDDGAIECIGDERFESEELALARLQELEEGDILRIVGDYVGHPAE